jgi:hypothetical protein
MPGVGKPFEFLAMLLITVNVFFLKNLSISRELLLFFLIFAISLTFSILIIGFTKSNAAIFIGMLSLLVLYNVNIGFRDILSILYLLIGLQYIDAASFYILDLDISFFPTPPFLEPRNYDNVTGFFRPVGVFSESNAFATTILFLYLTLLTFREKVPNFVSILVVSALFISLSFFAFFTAIIISFYLIMRESRFFFTLLIFILSIAFYLFSDFFISDVFLYRIEHFYEDPSFVARLGLDNGGFKLHNFFPSGFSTVVSVVFFGSNAFSFIIFAFGFLSLFIFYIFYLIYPKFAFALLMISFISFQMLTTLLFWLLVSVAFRNYSIKKTKL